MNVSGRIVRLSLLSAFISLTAAARADQWTQPTPEELSMTSQPQVPGAAAVYLFREETTDDKLHMFSIYVRLKILNELGKEEGPNVELNYYRGKEGAGFTVEDIQGRTIHPDGTIIPFTGKPYEKLVEKTSGVKIMAKVFSMPDVTIGSILEYRYKLRYDDMYFEAPAWYIQSNFWTRKAHYMWRPIDLSSGHISLTNARGQASNIISWTTVLPTGANMVQSKVPGTEQSIIDLNVQDIPPMPDEDYMPPIGSFSFRVLFYFTAYRTADEFWKNEGKYWAKQEDKFIGPGSVVSAAVKDIVAPSDTPDQKLRKIYAAVMKLENTRYTRQHTTAEEKAQGFKEVKNADDIWTRKRGSDDQLTGLFVSMARAAGLKAYVGYLTSRDRSIFVKNYLSLSELDDMIAIVNIDGKDQFFDPGTRYCPYGHLTWKHTLAGGIRQTDSGADFFDTRGEPYTFSRVQRIAELKLDPQGALSGKIIMNYTGDPAVSWRHRALIGDSASLEREIRTSVENLVPASLQLKVVSIDNVDNYEQPLTATFNVEGSLGTSTGKRVLLPGDIFEANTKPAFPHEKREVPVYFEYTRITQDAVRITYPATLSVESLPTPNKDAFEKTIAYNLSSESTANAFTIRRNYAVGDVLFTTQQYPSLRAFYSKIENKDQENVVLTTAPASSKPAGN